MENNSVSFYQKNVLSFETQMAEMINAAIRPYKGQLKGERKSQAIGKSIEKGFWDYSQACLGVVSKVKCRFEAKRISQTMAKEIAEAILVFFQEKEAKAMYVIDFNAYQIEIENLLLSFNCPY